MLFSACHALSAMLGLIMLIAPAVLADLDWAVTTMPSIEELCSGKIKLILNTTLMFNFEIIYHHLIE